MTTLNLDVIMGRTKPVEQAKPIEPIPISAIVKEINNNHAVVDIERMLTDRTIPLSERLKLREKLKALQAPTTIAEAKEKQKKDAELAPEPTPHDKETFSLSIVLNQRQQLAAQYAAAGKSFCLTGKAGTGKTTAAREIARSLLEHGVLGMHHFGYYKAAGPSIAFCAFTNRATDNMRKALFKDPDLANQLQYNVLTIHKLLEYTMEYYVTEAGNNSIRFYPTRNAMRPLDITHLVIEEASMVDIPLWRNVFAALKPGTVIIFIGDINQLPPVFGASILNYALINLPVVELDQVYRQALESPILSNALKVLDGIHPKADGKDFKMYQMAAGKQMPSEHATAIMTINQLKKWHKSKEYVPETDIVLSPFNKDRFPCGTKNLNNHIAQYLGDLRGAKIHQIIAGRNTVCLAEGDRVMVEKQDGTITKINLNGLYMGKPPLSNVCDINRFGKPMLGEAHASDIDGDNFTLEGYENLDVDAIPEEEKKQSASHAVHVKLDDDTEVILDSVGDFSDAKFNLGYCLSVHKAQGSEWRKVFFVIHRSFKVLLFRELIYTAMTRAREELVIIDTSNALEGAIASQRIKGNSVQEKIEWFNSKLALTEVVPIIP